MLVSAKQQTRGSQDYFVCLQPLTILKDQSHMSKVLLTLGAKIQKKHDWNWCLHDFPNVCSTNQLVTLKVIFPSENIATLFTLKLDFKMHSFVSRKCTFNEIQVTDIALFGFMDICHVLSQDVCSVKVLTHGLVFHVELPDVKIKMGITLKNNWAKKMSYVGEQHAILEMKHCSALNDGSAICCQEKNQYFPDNDERMSVHCLESGCIGKYTPRGPRDFPRAGILHPEARKIAPISWSSGGVFPNASRLEAVYGHSLISDREGLDLTLSGCAVFG